MYCVAIGATGERIRVADEAGVLSPGAGIGRGYICGLVLGRVANAAMIEVCSVVGIAHAACPGGWLDSWTAD